jgi:hypothetical protein
VKWVRDMWKDESESLLTLDEMREMFRGWGIFTRCYSKLRYCTAAHSALFFCFITPHYYFGAADSFRR